METYESFLGHCKGNTAFNALSILGKLRAATYKQVKTNETRTLIIDGATGKTQAAA